MPEIARFFGIVVRMYAEPGATHHRPHIHVSHQDSRAVVAIDPEADTLVWPNGADFDPATLHDWPTEGPRMAEHAARWRSA